MIVEEVRVVWVRRWFVEWSGGLWSGVKGTAAKLRVVSGALEARHMSLLSWWRSDVSHVVMQGFDMQAEVNGGSFPLTILQYRILQARSLHARAKKTDSLKGFRDILLETSCSYAQPISPASSAGSRCSLFAKSANPGSTFLQNILSTTSPR